MVTNLQAEIHRDQAALRDDVRALYGEEEYDSFEKSARGGYDSATSPDSVAEVLVAALTEVSKPETRYPVGADGVYLCGLSRTLSDRELDRLAKLDTADEQLNSAASPATTR